MTNNELEYQLKSIDQASFQKLCDLLMNRIGYSVVPFGSVEGENKTRAGTPDSYYIDFKSKKYTFFEYTTEKQGVKKKIINDLKRCFETTLNLKNSKLEKIIYIINNNNVDPTIVDEALMLCNENGVEFKIICLNELCSLLLKNKDIIREVFKIDTFDFGIKSLADFVESSKKYCGVNHANRLFGRDKDKERVINLIANNDLTILYGDPGVGKSILAVKALEEIDKTTLCIKSNPTDFMDELFLLIANNQDVLLFFDDVNEVPLFKTFLDSMDEKIFLHVKIVCTVRNYALKGIQKIVNSYKMLKCDYLHIEKLTNDVIESILEKNLNIKNNEWLKKLCLLSKGNPRIALMAGEIAIKEGVECLYDSKSIMMRYFAISNNDQTTKIINEYYDVLGIISFLKGVDKNNISSYSSLLTLCGVNPTKFFNSIPILVGSEIIDVYENQVVQVADQNLSDYLVNLAFIEKKICSIFDLLVNLFSSKRKHIVESLNILLNIYSSEETSEYIENEVLKAWEFLENSQGVDLDIFVHTFYMFNTKKAILYIEKKVKKNLKEYKGDAESFKKNYITNEEVQILFNIAVFENNMISLSLIFHWLDYETIRNDCFESLKNIAILKPSMFINGEVKNPMIFELLKYKDHKWFNYVACEILSKALQYNFEFDSYADERQITFNRFSITDQDEGIIEYRNKLWNLVLYLSDEYKYKLINSYLKHGFYRDEIKEIFGNDIKNINLIIESISAINDIKEKLFKVEFIARLQGSSYKVSDLKIHSDKDLELFILILDPREKRLNFDERKNNAIDRLRKMEISLNKEKICLIFEICNGILKMNSYNWKVIEFLRLFLSFLQDDLLLDVISDKKCFSQLNIVIQLEIVSYFGKKGFVDKLIDLFASLSTDVAIECSIALFNVISFDKITDEHKSLFKDVVKNDFDKNLMLIADRRIDTLQKMLEEEKEFIEQIEIIFSHRISNPHKTGMWLRLLFNENILTPSESISLFNGNKKIGLLEDIFLFFEKEKNELYELSLYFYEICAIDSDFLKKCSFKLLDYKQDFSSTIFKRLWLQKDANQFADIIFNIISIKSDLFSVSPLSVRHIFIDSAERDEDKELFVRWAERKIDEIDEKSILVLCDNISMCSIDLAHSFYLKLMDKEINITLFDKILSFPWPECIWTGNQVNEINTRINRLKILLSFIPNELAYLEYQERVEERIKILERELSKVKISERLGFDEYF